MRRAIVAAFVAGAIAALAVAVILQLQRIAATRATSSRRCR